MGRKLPRELSKRNLIRDNSEMIGNIKYLNRLAEELLAANIQLTMDLEKAKKSCLRFKEALDASYEEELHV